MLEGYQSTLEEYLSSGDGIVGYIKMGLIIYYVVIMGIIGLMILGSLLYAAWNVRWWKWLDFIGWGFLFFFMIIGFLLWTIFIIITVLFHDICQFI